MKLKRLSNLLLCIVLRASLAGCSTSSKSKDENKTIVVGATQVPGGDKNGIYTPNIDGTYVNVVACRTEDKNNEKIKVLQKVLTTDKARDFLDENFKGAIIPSF